MRKSKGNVLRELNEQRARRFGRMLHFIRKVSAFGRSLSHGG